MRGCVSICKASLQIADMDRNYHAEHALTIARHPSETDERMMARLLAFALNAHEHLKFGGGAPHWHSPSRRCTLYFSPKPP